ncbi:NADAR family protein [Pseudoflavonifractor sp. 524-17]|uniref:NADAR family protein n=1 Tax=Pseudoflavonifractor sp. 524-17 TaxID=2304577 RepID=UPI00137A8149|nr:NADAR family protein [Pseudoflavonifractor sp. 524-17]NCE64113.1 NADAR family protein [Pseudoflavonifractor sp. 524-17]
MVRAIKEFKGEYFFLSNFYIAPVIYQGIRFENNEAAFQAAKCPERMQEFRDLDPRSAKRLGQKVNLRPDWGTIKYDVMYQVCKEKFSQNPDLLSKLLQTGDAELIEGNTWGDRVWGVCHGVGENHLGKILMQVRRELMMTS